MTEVRKQLAQSQQQQMQNQSQMQEEFGAETDVNEVKKQVQQAEANKNNASGQFTNQFENGSK
ncbi:gamma-type small acid-soluble spore protein [Sporosarcina sp. G11-34]|nr:gamma-type small acid-soluble spore protein [Sporosarcina sp. G11-34]